MDKIIFCGIAIISFMVSTVFYYAGDMQHAIYYLGYAIIALIIAKD